MKRLHYHFSLAALLAMTTPMVADTQEVLNGNVFPPSPQAQDLVRYGKVPVSMYTGVPAVSIPLHTIRLKDLTLPVTLDYDASGVKVEQEAGDAGLGWTLRAGGVITHTIRGYNDEESSYYFTEGSDVMKDLTLAYRWDGSTLYQGSSPLPQPFSFANGMSQTEMYWRLSNSVPDYGAIDFCPDVYHYSFGSYSGSFIFTHTGEIVKDTYDNVRIVARYTTVSGRRRLSSFEATAPDGTKYYFTQQENAYDESLAAQYGKTHTSAFYLTRIETVGKTVVTFSYRKYGTSKMIYSRVMDSTMPSEQARFHTASYDNIRLTSVTYPGGTLSFDYVQDRKDLYGAPRLTSMAISGSEHREWHFRHSYFTADKRIAEHPDINYLKNSVGRMYYNDDWNLNRLCLDGMDQIAGTDTMKYRFAYNTRNLPSKLSVAQDHWSYFNNANNTSLVPQVFRNESFKEGIYDFHRRGLYANREPDAAYSQCYILNRITYPTGGYDDFVYEPHQYRTDCFEGDPYRKNYLFRPVEHVIKEKAHELYSSPHTSTVTVPVLDEVPTYRSVGKVNISVKLGPNDTYFRKYSNQYGSVRFRLLNSSGTPVWEYAFPAPDSEVYPGQEYAKHWYDKELMPDTYTMEVTGGDKRYFLDSLAFKVTAIAPPSEYISAHPYSLGGGLRVKSINTYDAGGRMLYGKDYLYTYGASKDGRDTSGKLLAFPRYVVYQKTEGFNNVAPSFIRVIGNGLRSGGASVGYSEVTVLNKDVSGKTVDRTTYSYINRPDSCLFYHFDNSGLQGSESGWDLNPVGIEPYRHSENGTLLKESKFLRTGSTDQCLETVDYEYKRYNGLADTYWGVADATERISFVCTLEEYLECERFLGENDTHQDKARYPHGYFYPALRPNNYRLSKKTVTRYMDGQRQTETSAYGYNPWHQLRSEIFTSDQINDTTTYTYPADQAESSLLCKTLTDSNRLDMPIKVIHSRNGSRDTREYGLSLFSGIPQIATLKTDTGTGGSMEVRSTVKQYDSHGNIVEVVNEDGIPVVYLWGYDFQYPVAEIRNATYSEVTQAFGTDAEKSGKSKGITLDRSKLPDALVTTYNYIPGVGISSVTDPNGLTRQYIYDRSGRLTEITDENGKTVQTYKYHYAK